MEISSSANATPPNPWVLNLQKLQLELKCPLCLNLLTKPVLLPCNHIFCQLCVPKLSCQSGAECAACHHHFTDEDLRPASYMETIVSIYKNMNAAITPLLSAAEDQIIKPTSDKTKGMVEYKYADALTKKTGNHVGVDEESNDTREAKRQKKTSHKDETGLNSTDSDALSTCEVAPKYEIGVCAFCHSSRTNLEHIGWMFHIGDGNVVKSYDFEFCSKIISVHHHCFFWTPNCYFVGNKALNLELELKRVYKIKCSGCGLKGAGFGCIEKSCTRTYHWTCAEVPGLIPNPEGYGHGMLCPLHSVQFPCEKTLRFRKACELALSYAPEQRVFCGSDLSPDEERMLRGYAALQETDVYFSWNPEVTDVIAVTDAKGACLRTFEVLMAILRGRRILDIKCKVSKLFNGICFYFSGKFNPTYKSHLIDLIRISGGTVNCNRSQTLNIPQAEISTNIVVYNRDDECTCDETSDVECPYDSKCKEKGEKMIEEAETLANGIGAWIIPPAWILESIDSDRALPR